MPPSDEELLARIAEMYDAVDPVPPGLIEACQSLAADPYDWRALTIRQLWCDAIVLDDEDPKRVEIRSRKTARRGPFLLHAGKNFDHRAADRPYVRQWMKRIGYGCGPLGAITGVAVLDDCHESNGCCGAWGDPTLGRWHWALGMVWRLPEPVPCRGALGFWRPPQDVLDAVLKQIGGAS